jgi:hypothetical protein
MSAHSRYQQDLTDLYRQGYSTRQITDMTGVPKTTVGARIRAAGLGRSRSASQIAGCRRKTAVPFNWSFLPLTPEKAWLLGLIYGDGSLRKAGHGFVVTSGDRDVIDNINSLFDGRLRATPYEGCWTIQANSARLFNELRGTFGLAPNKAAALSFPAIEAALLPHFVRGLLDSDGCWVYDTRGPQRLLKFGYTCKSLPFVDSLRAVLVSNVGVSECRQPTRTGANGSCWSLVYSNGDAIRIGQWLYRETAPHTRCERKYRQWHIYV